MGMNQILVTDSNSPKKNSNNSNNFNNRNKKVKEPKMRIPTDSGDVSVIVKFFAVLILIFGMVLSGNGVYAIIQNAEIAKNTKLPVVEVSKSGNTAAITIKCENGIRTVSYGWNASTPKVVQGRGNTLVEQTISIPKGENNKLNISVIDSKGQTRRYVKNLKQDERDTTEPTIEFEVVGSNIKIIVTDDTAIDYITYQFGDAQEVTVNAKQEGQTTIEETVPVMQGENTLKVEAVDKMQNVATREQKVKGTKKPTIEVIPDPNDPSYLIIKAYDDDGLRMVSYSINGQEYKTDPNVSLNSKTFEWKQKVEPGETRIIVHAYNISQQVTELDGIYNY